MLHGGQVFVMEFKVVANDDQADAALDRAMARIQAKGYSGKYRNRKEPIHPVAMVFGSEARNLLAIRVEGD